MYILTINIFDSDIQAINPPKSTSAGARLIPFATRLGTIYYRDFKEGDKHIRQSVIFWCLGLEARVNNSQEYYSDGNSTYVPSTNENVFFDSEFMKHVTPNEMWAKCYSP